MSESTKLNLSGWTYIGDVIVGVSCDCDCPEQDYNWLQGPHRPHESHDIIPPVDENDLPEGWTMEAWQAACRFIADAPQVQAENERLIEVNGKLAAVLAEVYYWISNWECPFTEDADWPEVEAKVTGLLATLPQPTPAANAGE